MRYLAEFMEKLPEDICMEMARHARIETASRDQVLVRPGDDAAKFYLVLSGNVEKSRSLRHEGRFVDRASAETLKKGDHFGSEAILKRERHAFAYTALGYISLLVIDREPFRKVYGKHIELKKDLIAHFMGSSVAAFSNLSRETLKMLAAMAEEVHLERGAEFETLSNDHVYIISKGQVNLLVPKIQSSSGRAERSKPRTTKARQETMFKVLHLDGEMDDHGKYINLREDQMPIDLQIGDELITVFQGVAYSTFGTDFKYEIANTEENSKVIAQLGPGYHFGGGGFINGEDTLLGDVKAFVKESSICLRFHRDNVESRFPEEVIQLLRNEAAFQLTYYLGRQGLLSKSHVVGHEEASIFDQSMREYIRRLRAEYEAEQARAYLTGRRQKRNLSAFQQKRKDLQQTKAEYMRKANEKHMKRQGDERDNYKNIRYKDSKFPVGYIMKVKSDMEAEHIAAMESSVLTSKGMPVERYWASVGSSTVHPTRMLSVLKAVFVHGLKPLADKIERIERFERKDTLAEDADAPSTEDGSGPSAAAEGQGNAAAHRRLLSEPRLAPLEVRAESATTPGLRGLGHAGTQRPRTSPAGCQPSLREQGIGKGISSVRSGSYLWEKMKGYQQPYIRQCLTFAEIARSQEDERRRRMAELAK
uniref:Cyclic nucleotide-binding domain-containing protein n=1 Tax=Tetraselmis sp. GSL018 TaxID=582737 RepID=A0A061RI99_9CHLO